MIFTTKDQLETISLLSLTKARLQKSDHQTRLHGSNLTALGYWNAIVVVITCKTHHVVMSFSQVLEGQKVLPVRAKELGFMFKYPYIRDALKSILSS